MIYSNQQDSVGLVSAWRCYYYYNGSWYEWRMVDTPSADSQTVTFGVTLPFDAVITRAWLTMDITPAVSGSAYQRVNGISIPSDGMVELPKEDFSASMVSYEASFSFRANGIIYPDADLHEGRLTLGSPTLHIEYNSVSEDTGDTDTTIVNRTYAAGIQMPRLLGDDFGEVARLTPISQRLELRANPLSKAALRIPFDSPATQIGAFLELFSPHGSEGIFRVIEEETTYSGASGRLLYLEHSFGTLADSLAIGTQSMQASVATVIATLLESQNVRHWVLGECEVPEDYELIYEYSYENLLQAITSLIAQLPPDYMPVFDTTRHPFVMHLRKLPDGDGCEMRMHRNLSKVVMTIDRTDLCTRVYPFGAGEGQDRVTLTPLIGAPFLDSAAWETWGLVSQQITVDDAYDSLTLKAVAERYLEAHDHPLVSVTADAQELSKETGEDMDYFRNGALCRLSLPDYGLVIRERVIGVTWPDTYSQPQTVTVQMANRIRDAADEIAELMRDATNSKLLGGTVETVEAFARAGSITPGSPFAQSFDITGYGNVLNVKITYSCVTSAGVDEDCNVTVDGNAVDTADATTRTVDITRYLEKDDTGVTLVGTHRVVLQPRTLNTVTSDVENNIVIKQIGKR